MSDRCQSLSHSRWHDKYHVVFVPKRRRRTLYGNIGKALGPIFHELARQKEMNRKKERITCLKGSAMA
jgi:putative transposase